MSINSALSVSINALKINQAALNVVSNNISNMNNENYSKQRVNLGTMHLAGHLANSKYEQIAANAGVQMNSISRYENEFLASYFRTQTTQSEYFKTGGDIADHITTTLDELAEGGLSSSLDAFYTAVSGVQQKPADPTSRLNFIQSANNLSIAFNTKYNDLTEYRNSLVGDGTQASLDASQTAANVDKINQMLTDLASINKRILSSGTLNSSANNLLDQRDAMLTELSKYLNISTSVANNGVASVSLGNIDLIRHTEQMYTFNAKAVEYPDERDDKRVEIQLIDTHTNEVQYKDVTDKITGGSLGAILEMGSNKENALTVQSAIDTINSLAQGVFEIMNDVQMQGWNANGTPKEGATKFAMALGTDANGDKILVSPSEFLFVTSDGKYEVNAGNFTINKNFIENPDLLALASVEVQDPTTEMVDVVIDGKTYKTLNSDDKYGVGNGQNMIDVLKTREKTDCVSLNNMSPEEFLMSRVSLVATQSESIKNQYESQMTVKNAVQAQWKSETSVDLNEELTEMLKFQHAFQASSRVFNACSQMLNELVNLGK